LEAEETRQVVVIGAGQAAAQAIQSLRQGGFQGGIALIGDEPHYPYQRPPLSKAFMKGEFDEERLYFRPAEWYQEARVDCRLNERATRIDRSQRLVIAGENIYSYGKLIIATGARPRKLPVPGADLAGVFDLRSLDDASRLRAAMKPGKKAVIIGAGYIGLEAAAVARQMNLEVTVLEMAPRVLARVAGPELAAFYEAEHKRQGVSILTNCSLATLEGKDGQVTAARLADGTRIEADLVLSGIGIIPNEELAREAGIACANGILTDRDGRTNDQHVFAAGDCAARPFVHYGRAGRLESVHNAIEQGKLVAAAILGQNRPVEDCPWFWSDQYDLKLQIAGLNTGYDQTITRGDPATRKFAVFYLKQSRIIAADAVNSPPEFLLAKKWIAAAEKVAPQRLGDTSIPIKDVVAQSAT
jgi:3-phenylpropionate/trans-cinnamate dioxygenase ferredoxin reductase subunit